VSRACRAKRPPAPIRKVVASAIRNVAMCGIADDLPVNVGAAAAEIVSDLERAGEPGPAPCTRPDYSFASVLILSRLARQLARSYGA
jgi:hypothetical protein